MPPKKRKRARAEAECSRLAEAHHGIVSTAEAEKAGLSKRVIYLRVKSRRWITVHPGVYRMAGTPETWHQKLAAACLWAGRGVAVSHRAAAALWGFAGFEEGPLELSTERSLRSGRGVTVHRVEWLPKTEVVTRARFPVTTATRTLMDLGAAATPQQVEEALEDALRRKLTDIPLLQMRLAAEGKRGRRGAGVLRALVARKETGYRPTESVFETKLRRLLRGGRLPPVQQHTIKDGRHSYRVDFAYPDALVAIEADSERFHFNAVDYAPGLQRRNALTRLGWRVLTVSWDALKNRPARVLKEVRDTLALARRPPAPAR